MRGEHVGATGDRPSGSHRSRHRSASPRRPAPWSKTTTPPWALDAFQDHRVVSAGADNAALVGECWGCASRTNPQIAVAACRSRHAQLIAPLRGMSSLGGGYDHPRRCPTHRAPFDELEDGTQA
jgi:hypothetical protein